MIEQANFAEELTKKVETGNMARDSGEVGGAIKLFEEVIRMQPDEKVGLNEDAVKAKEQATYNLGKIYVEKTLVEEIVKLTK